jgi:hypothetical protein
MHASLAWRDTHPYEHYQHLEPLSIHLVASLYLFTSLLIRLPPRTYSVVCDSARATPIAGVADLHIAQIAGAKRSTFRPRHRERAYSSNVFGRF